MDVEKKIAFSCCLYFDGSNPIVHVTYIPITTRYRCSIQNTNYLKNKAPAEKIAETFELRAREVTLQLETL